jgi:hypothetical protein
MAIDPGMMTDATGEGMSGGEDVSLVTQQNMKKTLYNGSKGCAKCGMLLDPFQALHTDKCAPCHNRLSSEHLKNRMAPK